MLAKFFYGVALATLSVTGASAGDAADDRSKVTLVYEHALPMSGKSIKGVLVEYEPGGSSPAHTHPDSAFIYATVLQGAYTKQGQRRPGKGLPCWRELLRNAGRPSRRQRKCQRHRARAPASPCSSSIPTRRT